MGKTQRTSAIETLADVAANLTDVAGYAAAGEPIGLQLQAIQLQATIALTQAMREVAEAINDSRPFRA